MTHGDRDKARARAECAGPPARRALALLLGLLAALALVEVGLRTLGFVVLRRQETAAASAMDTPNATRVLCIGESTTAFGGADAYPHQLEQALNELDPGRTYRVINMGRGGIDSSVILAHAQELLDRFDPRVVVAMMVANDPVGANHEDLFQPLTTRRAVPDTGTPAALRWGLPGWSKTFRLVELLLFNISQVGETAAALKPSRGTPGPGPSHISLVRPEPPERPAPYPMQGEALPEVRRAWRLARQGRGEEAEAVFRQAASGGAGAARARATIAWGAYLEQTGEPGRAEALFTRVLARAPDSAFALLGLGLARCAQGQYAEASAPLHRAARLDPRAAHGLMTLGLCHREAGQQALAQQALRLALRFQRALAPLLGDREEAQGLLPYYSVPGPPDPIFDRLAEPGGNPQDPQGVIALINLYEATGQHREVKRLVEQVMTSPPTDPVVARIALYYHTRGMQDRATRYTRNAARLRRAAAPPVTRKNYQHLQALLQRRGVLLVAAQYPNRPVAPLRDLIDWAPDTVIVDNQAVFQRALARHGYDAIFWDHCYGDLGHGTRLGNRILARNMAPALLRALGRRPVD